jgi:hypothetical protein
MEAHFLASSPHPLNQNPGVMPRDVRFNKFLKEFICALRLENHEGNPASPSYA